MGCCTSKVNADPVSTVLVIGPESAGKTTLLRSVGRRCAVCAAPQAGYYCGHCRHFDDSGAHTFHCPFCDVCRRGHGLGVDFHHCMRCNMCVDITQLATHVCTGAAGRACGACGGDLAATPDRVVVLGCGHPAHARCAAAPPGRCLVCARAAATD